MAKNLEGKKCPKFKAEATSNKTISNDTFQNQNFVNYPDFTKYAHFYKKKYPLRLLGY